MTEICLTRNATSLLRDVEHAYAVGEKVAGLKPVFSQGAIDPFRVFRSHRVIANDIVEGEDVVWREQLDLLLGALSALHIGGLQAEGAEIWRDPEGQFVWELLCHPAVIAYYERHYPFAPPLLLRAAGDRRLPDTYRSQWQAELEQEGFDAAYRQFLHLNARFISNDVIGYFIELLDDFYVFDTHIDEFRRVLEQPARLGGWLTRPDRWQLLEGMASFYEFALDLDQYLAALEFPMLRGHVWLHFAYWFGNGGARMEEVALWLQNAVAHAAEDESIDGAELGEALARLRAPQRYPLVLIEQTAEVLGPWLESSGVGEQLSAGSRSL
ncbi:hypothetical protein [Sinorhizobium meliloti]|uniref:Uncharacterized protein n=4 Tax=Rhizobium meliloti TaxID=382 RepID=F7XBW1_SINMM|nr:hypothetical protein [Sinorhizobium meliloti]AEH82548.1 hypothetical protein SM11_pC1475 [Sinorhizobium meliloti SM11]MBP2470298.1 hypothetical protein [Sinorhizobium meliloti]MDE3762921.1 hypothetical protein [Sinorhizobium meliloti]MDE3776609.1 hypothetical protein [Sinorhizobium meliloti]MDE3787967.1 hypothetical protein [Sinorhizobium meliloti]